MADYMYTTVNARAIEVNTTTSPSCAVLVMRGGVLAPPITEIRFIKYAQIRTYYLFRLPDGPIVQVD